MILLLRGAPGTGKSTTAAVLAAELGGAPAAAVVEVDDLRGELWHVPPAAALSDEQRHHLALAGAAGVALALLAAGIKLVIVVDTFAPEGVGVFKSAARGRAPLRAVTLLVEPGEHAHRLVTRPEVPGVFRDLGVASRMNASLATEPNEVRINTTGTTPGEVAGRVRASFMPRGAEHSSPGVP